MSNTQIRIDMARELLAARMDAYHEDGWKRKAAMALGGAAAIGAAGYLGGTSRGRGQVRQAAGYVKRKAGSAYGAAKQGLGQVRQKAGQVYGKAKGMARNAYEQVATHPRNPF